MSQSADMSVEVVLVDALGERIERASLPPDTAVGELIARARRTAPALGEAELLATWQGQPLAPQMTVIEVLFGFPVDDGPLEVTIAPRRDVATARIRKDARYFSLDRVLEELEVEYEELAGLVADGKIRAFRVEDTTRFSRADVLALKQARPQPVPEPTPAWLDLSLSDALSELNVAEQELVRLVSEGEIRAFRDGDQIRFRRTDIVAHRQRHLRSYYSLADVLRRLKIGERELARLVSEGQVRAFRDGDEMWFRRGDIDERTDQGDAVEERFFGREEVQRILGVAEPELARMVADGEIRAFRDGDSVLFPRVDVRVALSDRAIRERISPAPSTSIPVPPPVAEHVPDPFGTEPDEIPSIELDGEDDIPRAVPIPRELAPPVLPRDSVESTTVRQPLPTAPSAAAASAPTHRLTPRPHGSATAESTTLRQPLEAQVPEAAQIGIEARWRPPVAGRCAGLRLTLATSGLVPGAGIEIRLHAPGALVAPTSIPLEIGDSESLFALQPLAPGAIPARLELWRRHVLVGTIACPMTAAARPRLVPITRRLAWILPLVGIALALVGTPVPPHGLAGALAGFARDCGGWEALGLGAGAASLAVAAAATLGVSAKEGRAGGRIALAPEAPASADAGPPSRAAPLAITAARPRGERPPSHFEPASWPGCVAAGTTAAGFRLYRHERTGIELVEVPGGPFWRGAQDDDRAEPHERPARLIELAPFLIGLVPVTVSQFRRFVAEVPDWDENRAGTPEADDAYLKCWKRGASQRAQPVTEVSWYAAVAFCAWAELTLPTEAQWEKAARGTNGERFPWGGAWPTPSLARFADTRLAPVWDGGRYVGSHAAGASPYGVLDMVGNAAQWVADRYAATAYARGPDREPTGPTDGPERVVRGGSYQSPPEALRATHREHRPPGACEASLGFRVALGSPVPRPTPPSA